MKLEDGAVRMGWRDRGVMLVVIEKPRGCGAFDRSV